MTQINAEVGQISDGISKIADFQDNEYRSRVFSLISHIKRIAEFQVEILENEELRLSLIHISLMLEPLVASSAVSRLV